MTSEPFDASSPPEDPSQPPATTDSRRIGNVYLIRSSEEKRVKIGFTDGSVSVRRSELQVGSASRLETVTVLAAVPKLVEAELHDEFRLHKVRGEWFEDLPVIEERFRALRALSHEKHVDQALEHALGILTQAAALDASESAARLRHLEATKQVLEMPTCECWWKETHKHRGPVADFWQIMRNQLTWDLIPFGFAYDLYKAWSKAVARSSTPLGRNEFITDLRAIVADDPDWLPVKENRPAWTGSRMSRAEPLVTRYNLTKWASGHASGYRGITRVSSSDQAEVLCACGLLASSTVKSVQTDRN